MSRARFLFWLDVILLLALAPLEEPRTTGLPGHEWLGIVFVAVVGLHLLVNWRWIVATLRRVMAGDSRRARINAALNGALFLTMAVTLFSGLVISAVALPPFGLAPSNLRVWRPLHSLTASIALGLVGLHVGLNWDWIVGAVRKLRGRGVVHSEAGITLVRRLGLGDIPSVLRRLTILTVTTAALCGATFLLVRTTASAKVRPRRERAWAKPDLAAAPEDIGVQLLIVAVAAVVGRKVLKLRL
jgi:cytochrome b561